MTVNSQRSADVQRASFRAVATRRQLHRHPELAYQERRTATLIAQRLDRAGLEVTTGVAGTGVVGVLRGAAPGTVVVWRADMDAVAVAEQTRLPFASRVPGVMHACGHDGHVAIALGLAETLAGRREGLRGEVRFLFQPAEEAGNGAEAVLKHLPELFRGVDACVGLHLDTAIPLGVAGVTEGTCLLGAATFDLQFRAGGGHGATPHRTGDVIVAAAYFVTALQSLVSRQLDPMSPAVASVGSFQAGTAPNVLPDNVRLRGTLRAATLDQLHGLCRRVKRLAGAMATGHGVEVAVEYGDFTQPTINDPGVSRVVADAVRSVCGTESVRPVCYPTSDDVGELLRRVPGCYFFLGAAPPGQAEPHHSPRFNFDEQALGLGISVGLEAITTLLYPAGQAEGRPSSL